MTLEPATQDASPYVAYVYSYPHKTAYRPLAAPVPLRELWSREKRDALFLYLHVPFCEMRCGFCNLFTQARPKDDFAEAYVRALRRQAVRAKDAVAPARFARMAIGGGTPTQLALPLLEELFDIADGVLGARPSEAPTSVETSPETAEPDKLRLLRERGVQRVSIGVQSFFEEETRAVHRPQERAVVERALEGIRALGFPVLNVDLMYGLPGQTEASWLASLRAALTYAPEELYLYPLYVRPLTRMGRSDRSWDDERLALYRLARDVLRGEGYAQVSMRMFRRAGAPCDEGPAYSCQGDGMVGLGCGARSYTEGLHYSFEYAVGARGVREILEAYVARADAEFDRAEYGVALDGEEKRRRFAVLSLLAEGLAWGEYRARFGADARDELPELRELEAEGLARDDGARLALTERGRERSDAVGPRLFSRAVRGRMEGFALR